MRRKVLQESAVKSKTERSISAATPIARCVELSSHVRYNIWAISDVTDVIGSILPYKTRLEWQERIHEVQSPYIYSRFSHFTYDGIYSSFSNQFFLFEKKNGSIQSTPVAQSTPSKCRQQLMAMNTSSRMEEMALRR